MILLDLKDFKRKLSYLPRLDKDRVELSLEINKDTLTVYMSSFVGILKLETSLISNKKGITDFVTLPSSFIEAVKTYRGEHLEIRVNNKSIAVNVDNNKSRFVRKSSKLAKQLIKESKINSVLHNISFIHSYPVTREELTIALEILNSETTTALFRRLYITPEGITVRNRGCLLTLRLKNPPLSSENNSTFSIELSSAPFLMGMEAFYIQTHGDNIVVKDSELPYYVFLNKGKEGTMKTLEEENNYTLFLDLHLISSLAKPHENDLLFHVDLKECQVVIRGQEIDITYTADVLSYDEFSFRLPKESLLFLASFSSAGIIPLAVDKNITKLNYRNSSGSLIAVAVERID